MDTLVKQLNAKFEEWESDTAARVCQLIVDFADRDALDILRSRSREQEVPDLIDESKTG